MKEALIISIEDFNIELRNCGFFEFKKARRLQAEIDKCEQKLKILDETKIIKK